MKVGVLALQGAFREHLRAVEALGHAGIEVRLPADLDAVEALLIPGGESTTISKLMRKYGLDDAVAERLGLGLPAFGTCGGMILLASSVVDGVEGQLSLGAIDVEVRRNAFGRQVRSFEALLDVAGLDGPALNGVFIRAPWIETAGPGVEVLASFGGHAVAARQGRVMVAAFHPELTSDLRMHELFFKHAAEG